MPKLTPEEIQIVKQHRDNVRLTRYRSGVVQLMFYIDNKH